jgi:hypothetical protein
MESSMNRTMLRHPDGTLRAYLDYFPNGKKQICDPNGRPLGFYNPTSKTTHYVTGTLVGYGDLLTSLL